MCVYAAKMDLTIGVHVSRMKQAMEMRMYIRMKTIG